MNLNASSDVTDGDAALHQPNTPPWRAAVERVQERLAHLRARADGTLMTEISGPHFVVITKEGSEIRLWLMEQGRPSTGVVQSEIDLAAPIDLIEGYTQAMTLLLLWNPAPGRVFFSGLGGGRVPLVLHCLLPDLQICAADIDPQIIRIAESHFGLEIGNRISVDLADGRQWLEQRPALFDAIVVDVFLDNGYTPYRQATAEFYTLCRARLEPNGVLVINLLENDPYVARKLATLASIFTHVYTVAVDHENIIVFATDSDAVHPDRARSLAERLNAHWQLPFPFVERAARLSGDHSRFAENLESLEPFVDRQPPPGYFDALPALTGPFGKTNATLPCPCGSGRAYGICHGRPGVPTRA
ncbi:MAG: fused MFS/spermidine synthase [Litorilinea sp.]